MVPSLPWHSPPPDLTLPPQEIHVWRALLHQPAKHLERLERVLSMDERAKASRFRFEHNRKDYIVARGVLRHILGAYVSRRPEALQFFYSPYGKPALNAELRGQKVGFNVSHSGGYALYAIAIGREIGIDVERVRPEAAQDGVAERFFSPGEVASLRALPPHAQTIAFFNCWTRKEAYIKARGEGLSLPLNQFDVSLVPGEPARLLQSRVDPEDAGRWTLHAIPLEHGYVAALAAEGPAGAVMYWNWQP
ncbi:MAG: 4'-phosphopantetheinyl transferase superfamily protein [Rhodothermales bacterium]|nr:4'-phosphopantetheinyl transferase superfamily protein [Rhodothermales bacterium]